MKKTRQCISLTLTLLVMIFAHSHVSKHNYNTNFADNCGAKTNNKVAGNLLEKSPEHGAQENPFTQQDLINKFTMVDAEYTRVNKYDCLGVYPHILSFDEVPTWIKNAIPKNSEEEKRQFWQKAYKYLDKYF